MSYSACDFVDTICDCLENHGADFTEANEEEDTSLAADICLETIERLVSQRDALVAALDWFVTFCDEHEEWAAQQFAPDTAEGEWLETTRAALATAKGE